MRNLPRFALVPLAALIPALPLVAFASPAGADTLAECQDAFSSPMTKELVYTTDPGIRLAYSGQTVTLSAGWDPAAWDSLSSAVACIRLDDDTFAEALGTSQPSPANSGAFSHSFVIPQVAAGTRLCTRIRLAGDPAGETTEAAWVSKMHCYEVDHDREEETPPDDTETTPPPTQPPATTSTTVPVATPAASEGIPADGTPVTPVSSEGDSPTFDTAAPAGGPVGPVATTPEIVPLLPATGYASMPLLNKGTGLLLIGLGLLVSTGRPRRRHTTG
jgi:hypothetical protein